MKVLIASDDPRARAWVRMAIGEDWEVLEAEDGLEARALVRSEEPALLISDQTMERYGGLGLTREAKLEAAPPAAIVILERGQDVWLAKWANADRWFVRPVDPFALQDAARELTGFRRLPIREGTATEGGAS